jgi:hypothetical protein
MPIQHDCPDGFIWSRGCGCNEDSGKCVEDTHWQWEASDGTAFPCFTVGCQDDSQVWLTATSYTERRGLHPPMRRVTSSA